MSEEAKLQSPHEERAPRQPTISECQKMLYGMAIDIRAWNAARIQMYGGVGDRVEIEKAENLEATANLLGVILSNQKEFSEFKKRVRENNEKKDADRKAARRAQEKHSTSGGQ